MANEAILQVQQELPINFTCADGTGIEKGTLLKMTDNMTAIKVAGANDIIAGIAAKEKIANNGTTKIAVFRKGIFKMIVSGAVTFGDTVGSAATALGQVVSNSLTATISGSRVIGTALESATTGQSLKIAVNVGYK